ncbi:glucose 1-dehydrogenase [Cellulophaga sp. Hel_I_12]|uniref:glucose 1-dehydrogenase n=1 Tax=Cellulophaga sp. Hel_I_12 TaxID=1249972 RepID=UPI00064820ED|nr:glucose 1-dehydrogenase [Cellulophaga sp. Hel_I_12]
MKNFKNKTIIITGGASGLGLAAAKELASKGGNLSLVDYDEEGLKKAKEELKNEFLDIKVISILADVSEEEAVKNYVKTTLKEFGSIDGFLNNAGIEGDQAPMDEYDVDVFKKVVDINLMGVFYGLKYVLPEMKENGGKIVNMSSVGGLRGVINITPYVATKHSVAGMTKSAAMEFAKYNILTNALAPGAILTNMVAESMKKVNPENPKKAEEEFAKRNPMGRLGRPEEVAKVVAFLLSDDNSYINGQVIAIDGGESNIYGNL